MKILTPLFVVVVFFASLTYAAKTEFTISEDTTWASQSDIKDASSQLSLVNKQKPITLTINAPDQELSIWRIDAGYTGYNELATNGSIDIQAGQLNVDYLQLGIYRGNGEATYPSDINIASGAGINFKDTYYNKDDADHNSLGFEMGNSAQNGSQKANLIVDGGFIKFSNTKAVSTFYIANGSNDTVVATFKNGATFSDANSTGGVNMRLGEDGAGSNATLNIESNSTFDLKSTNSYLTTGDRASNQTVTINVTTGGTFNLGVATELSKWIGDVTTINVNNSGTLNYSGDEFNVVTGNDNTDENNAKAYINVDGSTSSVNFNAGTLNLANGTNSYAEISATDGAKVTFGNVSNNVNIGISQGAEALVKISSGSTLDFGTETARRIYLGTNNTAEGTIWIDGDGSKFNYTKNSSTTDNINLGFATGGTGTLKLTNKSEANLNLKHLFVGVNGTGSLIVDNSALNFKVNSPDVVIGRQNGNGSIEIKNGGVVSNEYLTDTNKSIFLYMNGDWNNKTNNSATSSFLLTGEGSKFNAGSNGNVYVGWAKRSTVAGDTVSSKMTISDKATFSAKSLFIGLGQGQTSTLDFNSGATGSVKKLMISGNDGSENAEGQNGANTKGSAIFAGLGTNLEVTEKIIVGTSDINYKVGNVGLLSIGDGAKISASTSSFAVKETGTLEFALTANDLDNETSLLTVKNIDDFTGQIKIDLSDLGIVNSLQKGEQKIVMLMFIEDGWGSEFSTTIAGLDNEVWSTDLSQIDFDLNQMSIRLTYIPEPSTYAAIFGVLALVFVACRRKK